MNLKNLPPRTGPLRRRTRTTRTCGRTIGTTTILRTISPSSSNLNLRRLPTNRSPWRRKRHRARQLPPNSLYISCLNITLILFFSCVFPLQFRPHCPACLTATE
ncbi:hypothetical protein BC940DRAFT_372105 [Gongronella butleri]|nr:hypothetical protein BC940DRAFT_372105 [Gongronella butleri]